VNVAIPLELAVGIGGFFGPCYQVELVGTDTEYTFSPKNQSSKKEPKITWERLKVTARKWAIFRKRLDAINVCVGLRIIPTRVFAMALVGASPSGTRIRQFDPVATTIIRRRMVVDR
jgi:hypothetical protein